MSRLLSVRADCMLGLVLCALALSPPPAAARPMWTTPQPPRVVVGYQNSTQPGRAAALHIVVLEGEDAVNIVQQRTAVAPIVEVRDRNDQPVAGAVVRFAIRTGRATFRGARTLSVTTNAAGRAVAEGLVPTGNGPLQIAATASWQGQTATITIAQSNVATAAQAAASATSATGTSAGAASGAGTGAGAGAGTAAATGAAVAGAAAGTAAGVAAGAGAAAGAAAGISTTALVVGGGAAVAAGAVVVTKVATGNNSAVAGTAAGATATVSGTFTGQTLVLPPPGGPQNCAYTTSNDGTLTMQYNESGGAVTGTATIKAKWAVIASPCGGSLGTFFDGSLSNIPLSGSPATLTFTRSDTGTGANNVTVTHAYTFTGSLANGIVTGTLTYTYRGVLPNGAAEGGSTQMPVTLR